MKRRTKERVAAVVAILLGASPLRAAVVTGPDGKPVRVKAGESAPTTPGATPPPAPGTPRTPPIPGLPGPLGEAGPPSDAAGARRGAGHAGNHAGGRRRRTPRRRPAGRPASPARTS